jgi:hypothetical protein
MFGDCGRGRSGSPVRLHPQGYATTLFFACTDVAILGRDVAATHCTSQAKNPIPQQIAENQGRIPNDEINGHA